jgi:hypothetical protein
VELAPHLDHGDEADRGEPLARGELVRLAYRLGRSHATGTLTVLARGDIVRGGPLVLRRGALVAAPADERATQARRRLARLAAAEAGRWWFDGGSAPYPPGASVTVPLAAWARQHLEAQLDGGRAEVLTGELAGRRLSLAPEQAPPADLLDEADRRVVAALAQPRRLDQLWTQARIPRFRLLSFLHFLRQVGALTVVEIGAHDSGPHRAAARGDSGPHARAAAAVAGAPPGAHAAALRVLGLAGPADRDTVKRAYRRLARALHPDLHPSADLARRRALEARLAEASAAAATLLGAPAAAS